MKILVVIGIFLMSCSFVKAETDHTELSSRARYQIIALSGKIYKLDLITGQTWALTQTAVKSSEGMEDVDYFWWREIIDLQQLQKIIQMSKQGN